MRNVEPTDYLASFDPSPPGLAEVNQRLADPPTCLAFATLNLTESEDLPDGIEPAVDQLMTSALWPTVTIDLPTGALLRVIWRNLEDESGVDLVLTFAGTTAVLSSLDGHARWPGLRWSECVTIASTASLLTPAAALVTLFPFVGDEVPPVAKDVLSSALRSQGVTVDSALVDRLLEAADVRSQLRGQGSAWAQRDGVMRFGGFNSTRGGAAPPEFLGWVDDALGVDGG